MTAATGEKPLIFHEPRERPASEQDSLPGRFPRWARWLAMAAFAYAFLGWLNESWLYWLDSPVWLNGYTEYAVIAFFGVWRITAERNPYTRKRLIILVTMVTVFWWLIPWLMPMYEPYEGYLPKEPVFPSLHTPGTVTFFLVLGAVLLFGRRVICGFNCPCVGIRETVGFAFRDRTLRGPWIWLGRHVKWLFFALYAGVFVAVQFPPNAWTMTLMGIFSGLVAVTYFGSFFLVPLTGNRFYCRYLCPYGATFGLLNHAGFYDLRLDPDKCIDCRRCEQVCDMGIPVWTQGKAEGRGRIKGLEDCMGCARCVVSCPTDALAIRDVRNWLRPGLVQDGSHLLKRRQDQRVPARETGPDRPAEGRTGDFDEVHQRLSPEQVRTQAARCLDCGVPGCRNACPLTNRVPDWLRAAAEGETTEAAALAHQTSPLPEVCGRLCPQHRLCEGACTRAELDAPVAIGAVERAVTEQALAAGWEPPSAPVRRTGRSAAVVGAGPAGLAAAERLNAAGWTVVLFDRNERIGGLLATGIPPFKLDRGVLDRRAEQLRGAGIELRLGEELEGEAVAELAASHDAVILGLGAQRPRDPGLPGQDLPGARQALGFLAAAAAGRPPDLTGTEVVVIGGGDTAMDCARTALRLGAATVTVAYRRGETELRASPRDVAAAREEGANLRLGHEPVAVEGTDTVTGVRFATADGERGLAAGAVILAVGQEPAPPAWLAGLGVATDDRGRIAVDDAGRTGHPRIYAAGDGAHGPDLVVTALAAGRRAAEAAMADRRPFRRAVAVRRLPLPPAAPEAPPAAALGRGA